MSWPLKEIPSRGSEEAEEYINSAEGPVQREFRKGEVASQNNSFVVPEVTDPDEEWKRWSSNQQLMPLDRLDNSIELGEGRRRTRGASQNEE